MHRVTGITTATLIAVGSAAWPAGAAHSVPIEHTHSHEVFVDSGIEDYCDLPGFPDLTVDRVQDFDITFLLKSRGPDGLAYADEQIRYTTSRVNAANGRSLTTRGVSDTRDLQVTDNGDGTLTIRAAGFTSDQSYDADGTVLHRYAGRVEFELLIDDNGTPQDPSDDEFVDFLGVTKEFVGHDSRDGQDFCEIVHEAMD